MQEQLELVKFNLTQSMAIELIKFNNTKKELDEIKLIYKKNKNKRLLIQIEQKERELIIFRNNFIREFRLNNKEQIAKYLKLKDHF